MFTLQDIIVAIILLTAVGYIGFVFVKKARSATKRSDCGDDCGCGKN